MVNFTFSITSETGGQRKLSLTDRFTQQVTTNECCFGDVLSMTLQNQEKLPNSYLQIPKQPVFPENVVAYTDLFSQHRMINPDLLHEVELTDQVLASANTNQLDTNWLSLLHQIEHETKPAYQELLSLQVTNLNRSATISDVGHLPASTKTNGSDNRWIGIPLSQELITEIIHTSPEIKEQVRLTTSNLREKTSVTAILWTSFDMDTAGTELPVHITDELKLNTVHDAETDQYLPNPSLQNKEQINSQLLNNIPSLEKKHQAIGGMIQFIILDKATEGAWNNQTVADDFNTVDSANSLPFTEQKSLGYIAKDLAIQPSILQNLDDEASLIQQNKKLADGIYLVPLAEDITAGTISPIIGSDQNVKLPAASFQQKINKHSESQRNIVVTISEHHLDHMLNETQNGTIGEDKRIFTSHVQTRSANNNQQLVNQAISQLPEDAKTNTIFSEVSDISNTRSQTSNRSHVGSVQAGTHVITGRNIDKISETLIQLVQSLPNSGNYQKRVLLKIDHIGNIQIGAEGMDINKKIILQFDNQEVAREISKLLPLIKVKCRDSGVDIGHIEFKIIQSEANKNQADSRTLFSEKKMFLNSSDTLNENNNDQSKNRERGDIGIRITGGNATEIRDRLKSSTQFSSNMDQLYAKNDKDSLIPKQQINTKNDIIFKEFVSTPETDILSRTIKTSSTTENMIKQDNIKEVVEKIVQSTKLQVAPGRTQIRVYLKPDYLGMVKIVIENTGKEISGTLFIERSDVRQAFELNLPVIQRNLQDQNIRLDRLDVQEFSNQLTQHNSSYQADHETKNSRMHAVKQHHMIQQLNENKTDEKMTDSRQKRHFGYNTLELVA